VAATIFRQPIRSPENSFWLIKMVLEKYEVWIWVRVQAKNRNPSEELGRRRGVTKSRLRPHPLGIRRRRLRTTAVHCAVRGRLGGRYLPLRGTDLSRCDPSKSLIRGRGAPLAGGNSTNGRTERRLPPELLNIRCELQHTVRITVGPFLQPKGGCHVEGGGCKPPPPNRSAPAHLQNTILGSHGARFYSSMWLLGFPFRIWLQCPSP